MQYIISHYNFAADFVLLRAYSFVEFRYVHGQCHVEICISLQISNLGLICLCSTIFII